MPAASAVAAAAAPILAASAALVLAHAGAMAALTPPRQEPAYSRPGPGSQPGRTVLGSTGWSAVAPPGFELDDSGPVANTWRRAWTRRERVDGRAVEVIHTDVIRTYHNSTFSYSFECGKVSAGTHKGLRTMAFACSEGEMRGAWFVLVLRERPRETHLDLRYYYGRQVKETGRILPAPPVAAWPSLKAFQRMQKTLEPAAMGGGIVGPDPDAAVPLFGP